MTINVKCDHCSSDVIGLTSKDIKTGIYLKNGSIIKEFVCGYEHTIGGIFKAAKFRSATLSIKLLEDIKFKYIICLCGGKVWLHDNTLFDYKSIIENYKVFKLEAQLDDWVNDD